MYKVRDMSVSDARSLTKAGSLWMLVLEELAPPVHHALDDESCHSLRQDINLRSSLEDKIINKPSCFFFPPSGHEGNKPGLFSSPRAT